MINFNDYTTENKTRHNLNWSNILDHPYRITIMRGPGSGKTNELSNLINNQPDLTKYVYITKDLYETKYQYLLMNKKAQTQNILMILKLLFNTVDMIA